MKLRMDYRRGIAGAMLLVAAALFSACSGDSTVVKEQEPEGELRLKPSSSYVKVGETVTFSVFKGETDVTANATIQRKGDPMPCGSNYVAEKAGSQRFYARYNEETTSFTPVRFYVPYKDEGEFFKTALVLKFTATWCTACPLMYSYLTDIEEQRPGRIAVIAVHSGDTFSIDECEALVKDFDISSYPHAVFDYKTNISNNQAELNEALNVILDEEPAVCGIALESAVSGTDATVTAKIRVAEGGRFRICCAVVEDGLRYDGGSSDDRLGNYYHVLRKFLTDRIGEDVGVHEAGDEFDRTYTFKVPEEWKTEKCTVFVYAMKLQEDGKTVYVNNTATCALDGGSSEFKYEPIPDSVTEK